MRKKLFLLILLPALLLGCISILEGKFSRYDLNDDRRVEANDTVWINYILSTEDKVVIDTSFEEVAGNWGLNLNHSFEPISIQVGGGRIISGLEEALLGMKVGEQREILVPPQKAFGERNETLLKTYSRTTVLPRIDVLDTETFRMMFGDEPVKNRFYNLNYWNITVLDIDGENVIISNNAKNNSLLTGRGKIDITVSETEISLELEPSINSTITTIDGPGKVVSNNKENYTVDFNHPLVGNSILIFVRVEEVSKLSRELADHIRFGGVEFGTSLEKGMVLANESGRPLFVYLHAAWCQWCRKFENDVLNNVEVIKILSGDFINIAIDVDSQSKTAIDLGLFGTPTMVFFDSDGVEKKRVRGYIDKDAFMGVLNEVSM
jgi:FKBP-type peptidyl-prolyl cis-trans isomerase 2